jgi:hypothetical protein
VSDDFDAFKNSGDGGEPPDGEHMATLVRAKVGESRRTGGTLIILEWQTLDLAYYWTVFRGVAGAQGTHTHKLLDALGVDLTNMGSWDELGNELAAVEGQDYRVKVKRNGDYLNTDVLDKPANVQTQIPVAGPAQPAQSGESKSAIFDDDDIPF